MKKIIFLLFLVSAVLYTYAQENDSLIIKANNLYSEAEYQEAINTYNSILENGYESSEIYYNIANAYYKEKLIALAILNYEKAILLSPNDNDIKYNLELSNRLVIDKIEVLPVFFLTDWIRNFKSIFSSDLWAIISLVSFIVIMVFILIYFFSRNVGLRKLSFIISIFTVIIFVISLMFSYQQKQSVISGRTAIVVSPSVTVKSSPDNSGTDLFVIHEGTKVWIEDKISDWNEIKLSDGSIGWIKTEDIEII